MYYSLFIHVIRFTLKYHFHGLLRIGLQMALLQNVDVPFILSSGVTLWLHAIIHLNKGLVTYSIKLNLYTMSIPRFPETRCKRWIFFVKRCIKTFPNF